MTKESDHIAEKARYRVSMKRKLRLKGVLICNDEPTAQLEGLMRLIGLESVV